MPITASMGALTYSRTAIGPDFEYWAMRILGVNNGNPVQILLHPSEFKIYVTTSISNIVNCYGIEVGNNFNTPIRVFFNKTYGFDPYPNVWVGAGFIDTIHLYVGICVRRPFPLAYPYYVEGMPGKFTIRLTDGGNVSYDYRYVFPGGVSGPPNDSWNEYFTKITRVAPSTYYIISNANTPGYPDWEVTLARYQGNTVTGWAYLGQTAILGGITVEVDSSNRAVTLWSAGYGYNLRTHSTTAGPAPSYFLSAVYNSQVVYSPPQPSAQATDLKIDSAGNKIITVAGSATTISFVHSINPNQTAINWQVSISDVSLQRIWLDSSDNVYVVGVKIISSISRLYVFKFNNAGVLQWQRQIFQSSGLTSPRIIGDTYNGYYIVANNGAANVVFRLPTDGTIPGTGTYYYVGGTYVYSASSLTVANTAFAITAGPAINDSATINLIGDSTGTLSTNLSTNSTKIAIT